MIHMICKEFITGINEIKIKKAHFDDIYKTDIPKAIDLKKELQSSIKRLKEIIPPIFRIEGKEFPIIQLEIGGKTGPEIAIELNNRGVKIYRGSDSMLKSPEFLVARAGEKISTVRLQVRALFSDEDGHDYSEILARANELGLGFLPHETAADLLLNEKTQPKMGEYCRVVSNPISESVFELERNNNEINLRGRWAMPEHKWYGDAEFIFQVPTK